MTTAQAVLHDYLRPYQHDFIRDQSRKKIILKSRRIGISEAVCIEALLEALTNTRRDVYLCSTSLRDAKELLRTVAKWIEVLETAGVDLPVQSIKATSIEFDSGSRIIAIPAKKVRGRTGTIVLDEFAFYQHDQEVWRAVAPAIESSPDLRIIIISTPFGASGVFHEIWADPNGYYGDWSRHKVDVYEAATQGFPVDPEELQKQYAPDVWRQEFCCEFLSDIDQYFPYDLIRRCQVDPDDMPDKGPQFAGIDLASERDASCMASLIHSDATFAVPELVTVKKAGAHRDYSDQFADIEDLLAQEDYEGVAVDATGEGAQLGQDLRRRFGRVIEEIRSGDWKTVYQEVSAMRLAMERGQFLIPNDPNVRNAFAKIQKKESTSKRVRYEAVRDAQGHADEFSAILLAYYVARAAERTRQNTTTTQNVGSLPRKSSRLSGGW